MSPNMHPIIPGRGCFRSPVLGALSSAGMPGRVSRHARDWERDGGALYGAARTVRSRMPSVAFSADSGMIGHAPVAFQFSPTFDQS